VKFEVLPPAEQGIDLGGPESKRELPDHEELNRLLQEAARATRAEDVEKAIEQVASGEAKPEALLEWMDDLRDPDQKHDDVDPSELQEGMVPDFMPDHEMAGGTLDLRDPTGEAKDAMMFSAAKQSGEVGAVDSDADADYFFSVLKKRRGDPGDDDSGGGEENAPQHKKGNPQPDTVKKTAR